jgi:hypothetical protein
MDTDKLLELVGKRVRRTTKGGKGQKGTVTHVFPDGRVVVKIPGRTLKVWKPNWFELDDSEEPADL